jgi:hypothetical protein
MATGGRRETGQLSASATIASGLCHRLKAKAISFVVVFCFFFLLFLFVCFFHSLREHPPAAKALGQRYRQNTKAFSFLFFVFFWFFLYYFVLFLQRVSLFLFFVHRERGSLQKEAVLQKASFWEEGFLQEASV